MLFYNKQKVYVLGFEKIGTSTLPRSSHCFNFILALLKGLLIPSGNDDREI